MGRIDQGFLFLRKIFQGEDPLIIKQDKQDWDAQFSRGSWDRLVLNQPNTQHIAKRVVERCTPTSTVRVLDVGCGNGGLARLLAPYAEGIEYTGLDLSSCAVDRAREEFPGGVLHVADALVPPAELGVFDLIIFNEVIYYIDPRAAIRTYLPHLAPRGSFIISVIRSWRSPLIWHRIRSMTRLQSKEVVSAGHVWDVAEAVPR